MGRKDEAAGEIRTALCEDPSLSGEYIKSQELFEDTAVLDQLIDSAAEAGLPVSPGGAGP